MFIQVLHRQEEGIPDLEDQRLAVVLHRVHITEADPLLEELHLQQRPEVDEVDSITGLLLEVDVDLQNILAEVRWQEVHVIGYVQLCQQGSEDFHSQRLHQQPLKIFSTQTTSEAQL